MRVNEIFYSLQGEGAYTGTASIFIRLSGCNLACDFCDTKHQPYKDYTKEEIAREIAVYEAKNIVFTGGEPSLQLDAETIDYFHKLGYFIQVETNGTRKLPYNVDWVTCSPKSQNIVIQRIDELKVVHTGQALSFYEEMPIEHPECRYLQPCDERDPVRNAENFARAVDYIKAHPVWKLSLQTHKLTGIK